MFVVCTEEKNIDFNTRKVIQNLSVLWLCYTVSVIHAARRGKTATLNQQQHDNEMEGRVEFLMAALQRYRSVCGQEWWDQPDWLYRNMFSYKTLGVLLTCNYFCKI